MTNISLGTSNSYVFFVIVVFLQAVRNTRMLAAYANIDERVQLLGYALKEMAKVCIHNYKVIIQPTLGNNLHVGMCVCSVVFDVKYLGLLHTHIVQAVHLS